MTTSTETDPYNHARQDLINEILNVKALYNLTDAEMWELLLGCTMAFFQKSDTSNKLFNLVLEGLKQPTEGADVNRR